MYGITTLLVIICYSSSLASCDYTVETNVGVIKGLASNDGSYVMYMGIPYAVVNDSNPFGIATQYPCFESPYEAYDDSTICPQLYPKNNSIVGSLDCLRLNVYVPSTVSPTDNLPVMIWIHGGGFKQDSAGRTSYGPKYLVRHDVIIVTINYRVGPYGFMCLDIAEVAGNQGLKDQYMAIKWVFDNINAFGGDVNNIILFGQSAGGHSIEFHLRSQNKVLFDKIIMESGSAVAGTVFAEPDKEAPIKLAKYLNYTTIDLHEALDFLASSEPKEVIKAYIALGISFKPCVEKEFDGVDNFLTTTWVDTPVPKVENMPVLLGFNKDERMTTYLDKDSAYFKHLNIFNDNLQLTFNFSKHELAEMEQFVQHFYLGDQPISNNVVWPIIYFDSDFIYIHPVQRTMEKFIESKAGDIFYYMFSYSGGRNSGKINANITEKGAAHEDELGYLFDMTNLSDEPTAADQLVIDRMTKMWTNFAKYSDPIPVTTDLLPVKWIPVTADIYYCMNIASKLTLTGRPLHERLAFWDLFYKMNEPLLKTFD